MNTEELNSKIELTETAIGLYLEDGFSIPALSEKSGKSASQIYTLFPNKKAILKFYYPSLIYKYRAMVNEIDDFQNYTIGEKLSNFMYTLMDMMDERKSFVEKTFVKYEWNCSENSEFQQEVKDLFNDFFTTDGNIATSAGFLIGDLFYSALKSQYLYLIKFWIQDDSDGGERTYALIDKMTGLIEELVYSKIVDKGFDLFKYIINTTGLRDQLDDLNQWASHWFETTTETSSDSKEESEHE